MKRYAPVVLLVSLVGFALADEKKDAPKKPLDIPANALVLVVMDPLAAPLSCPCVEGYAQRNYDKLAELLTSELGRPVVAAYNASLPAALKMETGGRADIVIGKHSVVLYDAKRAALQLKPILSLSGKEGDTTMTGLFVVASSDPAKSVADLQGYRIFFGTEDSDEKYAAAFDLLKRNGIPPPNKPETCVQCSDGATKLLELGPAVRSATVISSYAAPLLEGCGTVKKGDLKIIGTTAKVPFVEVFVSEKLAADEQAKIDAALQKVALQPEMLTHLETLIGFVPIEAPAPQKKS
jgi:ABC-type phosphate/phosphonate transport system substrate-binding protein